MLSPDSVPLLLGAGWPELRLSNMLVAQSESGSYLTSVLTVFGCVAAFLMLAGALLFSRRRAAEPQTGGDVLLRPAAAAATRPVRPGAAAFDGPGAARKVCHAFHTWLAENADELHLWTAFDQLLREMLTEHLGAVRVRCYHVRPGSDALQTIAQRGKAPPTGGPSLRDGVLGHVATTGQEFVAGDPAHGPLIDDLAAQAEDAWDWIWPVRDDKSTIGVVAIGQLREPGARVADVRQAVGELVSLCWQHVACLEQLHVVRRTDQASGGLTRNDFFTLAGHALADSYELNEPVVVAVLALEGLRHLDDTGRWRERDDLVETLGRLLAASGRSDDLVGRFADDRFVVLLRRLDSGLGRLIARKILSRANEHVMGLGESHDQVRLRIGLAGSGLAQPALEALLISAFNAVERARKENLPIVTDLEDKHPEPDDRSPARGAQP